MSAQYYQMTPEELQIQGLQFRLQGIQSALADLRGDLEDVDEWVLDKADAEQHVVDSVASAFEHLQRAEGMANG